MDELTRLTASLVPPCSVVDCANLKSMPDVAFNIGGKAFRLTPDQYVLKVRGGLEGLCLSGRQP